MRVLVVEDEPTVARAVQEGLAAEHYDVVVAHTGEDGFFYANAETFDVVVLDLMVTAHPQGVALAVTDTGLGIAPQHRAHVFDRFYRVDTARSRALGGTGLGLAIARWAVEAHGGRIELEGEEGKRSTFRIVLPAATSPPSPGHAMRGHARRG